MKRLKDKEREKLIDLLDLPPAAQAIFDNLVGTLYGDSTEDVLRFIVIHWLHTNLVQVEEYATRGK